MHTVHGKAIHTKLLERNDLHLLRKTWHISTGLAVFLSYLWLGQEYKTYFVYGVLTIGFFSLSLDLLRIKFKGLNRIVCTVAGPLMRKSEADRISGMPYYAFGCALSLLLFKEEIALVSILFLILADPISSLIGILYGRQRIAHNKSLQGSLAGFTTCFLICFLYFDQVEVSTLHLLVFSILAGIVGSLSELASALNIDDNLTIPLLSGLGLTFLNSQIPMF